MFFSLFQFNIANIQHFFEYLHNETAFFIKLIGFMRVILGLVFNSSVKFCNFAGELPIIFFHSKDIFLCVFPVHSPIGPNS